MILGFVLGLLAGIVLGSVGLIIVGCLLYTVVMSRGLAARR